MRDSLTKPFFIFSPYQIFQDDFINTSIKTKKFISQTTFRTNIVYENVSYYPLTTFFNRIFSFYSTEYLSHKEIIDLIKDLFEDVLGFEPENLYWRVPSNNLKLINTLKNNNIIPWSEEHLNHPYPNLQEKGMLIKLEYKYNNGIIPICNFVLIGNNKEYCKLDSVVYLDRVLLIMNNQNSLFDSSYYEPLSSLIKTTNDSHNIENNRILLLLMRTIIILLSEGVYPSTKKAGYYTRKLIREFLTYTYLMDINREKFLEIAKVMSENIDIICYEKKDNKCKSIVYNILIDEYEKFNTLLNKNLKVLEDNTKDFETILETYGIPIKISRKIRNIPNSKVSVDYKELNYRYNEQNNFKFEPINWYQTQVDQQIEFNFNK